MVQPTIVDLGILMAVGPEEKIRGWKGELVSRFGRFAVHVSLLPRRASFILEHRAGRKTAAES